MIFLKAGRIYAIDDLSSEVSTDLRVDTERLSQRCRNPVNRRNEAI